MQYDGKIEEFEVRVGLALSGYSMSDLARGLGVSSTLIREVIGGRAKSKRVKDYIESKMSTRVKITVLG